MMRMTEFGRRWGLTLVLGIVTGWVCGPLDAVHGQEEHERHGRKHHEHEGRREHKRKPKFVSEDAYHLYRKAMEHKERGHLEEAKELLEKAERIEREAIRRRGHEREERERKHHGRERREHERPRFTSDDAYELWQKAEHLAREGRLPGVVKASW